MNSRYISFQRTLRGFVGWMFASFGAHLVEKPVQRTLANQGQDIPAYHMGCSRRPGNLARNQNSHHGSTLTLLELSSLEICSNKSKRTL